MPYPSEHAARVKDPGQFDSFKRMNQGSGVSLVLGIKDGKSEAQAYRFKKEQFTPVQAKAWLKKHNIKFISFEEASDVKAKLSMKASKPEIDGRIWSAGIHHVFVNDAPAKVYVPEETIMDTFNSVRALINKEGRMPIGIDHLSDSILNDNEILAKMNLLDVGSVSKVGTDGQSIYILDSELSNEQIRQLHSLGELPAYSIVGAMDASECPSGQADYVVNSIDVERVDIVEEGGCQVCKVGAQPTDLILTSKRNMEEFNMDEHEAPVKQKEEVVEEVVEEVPVEEVAEETAAEEVVEVEVVEEEEVQDEVEDINKKLLEKIESLEAEVKELGGKKPKVEARDAEEAVNKLIKAGKALPKMKAGLIATYEADPDAFATLAASMPKMVQMDAKAKLAKKAKKDEEEKTKASEEAILNKQIEEIFRVKL